MKITIFKITIFKSTLDGGKYAATIDGPWYDDSNPRGIGDTQQEALDSAWADLLETQKEINEFVALGKPTLEQTEQQN